MTAPADIVEFYLMRPLETVITGLLAVAAVWSLAAGSRSRAILAALFVAEIVILILHFIFEGSHWQMGPAYLGILIFACLIFLSPRHSALLTATAVAMLLLTLSAAVLSAILPMFHLPEPTGRYLLGTRILHFVDTSRTDVSSPSGKRELMVQVWYPSAPSHHPYAPYRRRDETTLLSSYQSRIKTHARWNTPMVQESESFPVLLFNPAWTGRRTQNTFLVEDLVSHGYVVAAIDHTHNSGPVAFPGGRVVQSQPDPRMPDFNTSTLADVLAAGTRELEVEVDDNLFVLNELAHLNQDPSSAFFDRLRIDDSGAFGHSFGGAVAAEACARDPRIRAALDLDGSFFGPVRLNGLPKPLMLMEQPVPRYTPEETAALNDADKINNELNLSDDAMIAKYGGYRIYLRGATHGSFTDKPLFSPFRSLSERGDIPPLREFHIIRSYTLAFFDQELKGTPSPLLSGQKSPFDEVEMYIQAAKAAPAK